MTKNICVTIDDATPTDPENNWCLSKEGRSYLIYSLNGGKVTTRLIAGDYQYHWFTPQGKQLTKSESISTKGKTTFNSPKDKPGLLLINALDN